MRKKPIKEEKKTTGKLGLEQLRKALNKKAGSEVAYDLRENNPAAITHWIPTGSRLLDSSIAGGRVSGIPGNRLTEICGLESAGKSYLAASIAANAINLLKMDVVYFESESSIDEVFLERMGCDLSKLLYVQATTVEFVLEMIEELVSSNSENNLLIIWDSFAMTPSIKEVKGNMDPNSQIGVKARVMSRGISKLQIPIANANATVVILNQLI